MQPQVVVLALFLRCLLPENQVVSRAKFLHKNQVQSLLSCQLVPPVDHHLLSLQLSQVPFHLVGLLVVLQDLQALNHHQFLVAFHLKIPAKFLVPCHLVSQLMFLLQDQVVSQVQLLPQDQVVSQAQVQVKYQVVCLARSPVMFQRRAQVHHLPPFLLDIQVQDQAQ